MLGGAAWELDAPESVWGGWPRMTGNPYSLAGIRPISHLLLACRVLDG